MMGIRIILTPEQERYIIDSFPDTANAEICERIGCGETFLREFAIRHGLKKSAAWLEKRKEKARVGLHRYYLLHRPKGNAETIREYQFKKGNDPRDFGDRYWEAFRRGQEKRNRIIREEKARIAFGLPQKTKLHLKSQPRGRISQRSYLKKLGYILDEDRRIAYWTPETTRATRIEARVNKKNYYTFKEYEVAVH